MNTRQDCVNNHCFICHTTLEECYCHNEFDDWCGDCNLPLDCCECYDDFCYKCGESPTFCECDEVDNNKY